MNPPQVRAYSQHCVNGHEWMKITSTGQPDKVCPYCASTDVTSTVHWTFTIPRTEQHGS